MADPATVEDRSRVRSAGRAARASVNGSQRTRSEASLVANLQSLDVLMAPVIGVFVAHDGEPDLMPLVEWLWTDGRTVALPVLVDDADDYTMKFVPWRPDEALVPGRYGIPVPPTDAEVIPDTLLVSFVGFDRRGNRIGRGGGFFDRYLADYPHAVVGVGFEVQRVDAVPTQAHDKRLPVVVTDLGVRFPGLNAELA